MTRRNRKPKTLTARLLRQCLDLSGLAQHEFAAAAGLSQPQLCDYLHDRRETFRLDRLPAIAKAAGCAIGYRPESGWFVEPTG